MRDEQKLMLKKNKQQILALILSCGKRYEGGKSYWTIAHIKWLSTLNLKDIKRKHMQSILRHMIISWKNRNG